MGPHPSARRPPMSQLLDLEALREELERKDRELRLVADVSAMIGRSAPLR